MYKIKLERKKKKKENLRRFVLYYLNMYKMKMNQISIRLLYTHFI